MTLDELFEEFEALEDWEERCEFLIDMGFELPDFPDHQKTERNRVHGCQSNVWLIAENITDSEVQLLADSDAMIVRGLIFVILTIFSGQSPQAILETDVESIFDRLELNRHLSSQRKNGLSGMVERIRKIAEQAV
ncbi:MAG: cysteine desulfuration protein SufE [Planctomycetaceae bacterium]|nr:cysteine desulfuration protein SufE [Planctomycetaceae bacterium]